MSSTPKLAKEVIELMDRGSSPVLLNSAIPDQAISNTALLSHTHHHPYHDETSPPLSVHDTHMLPAVLGGLLTTAPLPPIQTPFEPIPTPMSNSDSDGALNSSSRMLQKRVAFQHLDQQGSSDEQSRPSSRSKSRPLPPIGSSITREHFSPRGRHLPPLPFQNIGSPLDVVSLYSMSSYSQLCPHSGSSVSLPLLPDPRYSSAPRTSLPSHGSGPATSRADEKGSVQGPGVGGEQKRSRRKKSLRQTEDEASPSTQSLSPPLMVTAEDVEPAEGELCSYRPCLPPSSPSPPSTKQTSV